MEKKIEKYKIAKQQYENSKRWVEELDYRKNKTGNLIEQVLLEKGEKRPCIICTHNYAETSYSFVPAHFVSALEFEIKKRFCEIAHAALESEKIMINDLADEAKKEYDMFIKEIDGGTF